jgi:hypothetical protein
MSDKYNVKKIDADNMAMGKHATVISSTGIKADQSLQADALQQVEQLIALLSVHADQIESPDKVQADAAAAQAALSKKRLNRARIENLVSRMAVGVAGVTTLANAVDAVQTAISRLFT